MYVDQLSKGGNYSLASPSISTCLLSHLHFPDTPQPHHRFQMVDKASGREINNAIEVHTVELTKYHLAETTIMSASKLEQWAFLLLRAQDYEAESLKRLLPGKKAQRDYEWALNGASEEGRKAAVAETVRLLQDLAGEPLSPIADRLPNRYHHWKYF